MRSEADPAFGNVKVTVDVVLAPSVTTLRPFGSVVTEADVARAGSGLVVGTLVAPEQRTLI